MMSALAAETAHGAAGAAHAAEPFYATAEFWVAVAFVILVSLVGRRLARLVAVALDARAEQIKNRIDEATRLAEEAQVMLATYERKQRDAAAEAEAIVAAARREAERLAADSKLELERTLARREQMAIERIAQAEQAAVADVRARAVDVAVDAVRRVMADRLSPAQADALVDQAIQDLPRKLH